MAINHDADENLRAHCALFSHREVPGNGHRELPDSSRHSERARKRCSQKGCQQKHASARRMQDIPGAPHSASPPWSTPGTATFACSKGRTGAQHSQRAEASQRQCVRWNPSKCFSHLARRDLGAAGYAHTTGTVL
eukprot:CAMPEP_0177275956 /NCGR_PEP_ID=MMETSP0367-20130122/68000_1 /TAXON_ID=447022 ORGANISM="Scrippsiella hangoei-like, Strain SHHI-4" /NCGR_SAMPLE_ID=MMETSP0367 /ASSEMBLY_ACC=CAM_ASM_000362 /LENGTH=134 /DNA_ID=CAMNT_0018732439 /DNA_START=108 /DNA_END=512 /DNA_ORIENTATION=+